jgi:hypothetical protein
MIVSVIFWFIGTLSKGNQTKGTGVESENNSGVVREVGSD